MSGNRVYGIITRSGAIESHPASVGPMPRVLHDAEDIGVISMWWTSNLPAEEVRAAIARVFSHPVREALLDGYLSESMMLRIWRRVDTDLRPA